MTCAVSGLPVKYAGPVRYLLLAIDVPRGVPMFAPLTPPMVCSYYDHGRVRELTSPLMERAWLSQLRECLVTRPVGVNAEHDVAVSRNAPLEKLIDAVQEGRLVIRDPKYDELLRDVRATIKPEARERHGFDGVEEPVAREVLPPPDVPTWRRVARALRSEHIVNVRAFPDGFARVMVKASIPTKSTLDAVVAAVEAAGFVALRVGDAVLVTPRDYRTAVADRAERRNRRTLRPRRLSVVEAFIREDVWQTLVALRVGYPVEYFAELLCQRSDAPIPDGWFYSSPADTYQIARSLTEGDAELRGEWPFFEATYAELLKVDDTLRRLHFEWAPSRYGGQLHEWGALAEMFAAWSDVARQCQHDERVRDEE